MAETVGRVDFIAGLDGRVAVSESRALGEKIGQAGDRAGSQFGDRFDRELTPRMRLAADRAAKALTSGLNQIDMGGISKALGRIDSSFNDSISRMIGDTEHFRLIFDQMGTDVERRSTDIARISKEVDFGRWSHDAGTFRQVFRELEGDVDRLSITAGQNTIVWRENQRAIEAMTDSLGGAGRGGDGVADSFRDIGDEGDDSFRRASRGLRGLWDSIDVGTPGLRKLNFEWSDLSHNTKQWTLIIGAVMAGMSDLASLSSAAGAGILALGGGLSAAILGAGGAAAVFSVLAKDVSALPPELRGAAVQFRALGDELVNTRDIIASSAIQRMPNTFAKLGDTVRGLNPAFALLGTAVGNVFDDLADGLQKSTPGFRELNGLVLNASQDFPALANATGIWATALLRGLNNANPLVDQMIGYIGELGNRFDDFTKSDSFGQWISQSMTTFTAFGDLLDATSRALNDLVTPEAVARTQEFLGNLTEFMPNLSLLLDVLGRVDVFGLAAEALNEFGDALYPLSGPAADLADVLNDVASILIGELATALGAVANFIAPVVQGFADVVGAIPPGVLAAIATGVIGVAAAFNILRGAQGIAGAANAALIAAGNFGTLTTVTGGAERATGKLASGLGALAGRAGMFGLAAVGAVTLVAALDEGAKALMGLEDSSRNAVASGKGLKDSFDEIGVAANLMAQGSIAPIKDWDSALTALGENDFALGLGENFVKGADEGRKLKNVLEELDGPLATLAGQNLPAASAQFAAWATEVGATDAQILNMINRMPEFKGQLEAASVASGDLATDTDLVTLALTGSTDATTKNKEQISILSGQALITGTSIADLTEKLRMHTEQTLNSRNASRNFESATDDLAASIAENGNTLDVTTEQGRRNEQAVDDLAAATLRYSDETLKNTGSQRDANAVIAEGRQRLIDQLDAFGITGAEAEAYADKLGLIPADVSTNIRANGLADAYNTTGNLQYRLSQLNGSVFSYTMRGTYIQVGNREVGATPYATGGRVYGATHALIGEAGPEAVVPLNRPLNQVDPSVRALSAIAQGLAMPAMASGGIAGAPQTIVNIEPGAIVVQAADDPRQTAYDVLDVIAENIAS